MYTFLINVYVCIWFYGRWNHPDLNGEKRILLCSAPTIKAPILKAQLCWRHCIPRESDRLIERRSSIDRRRLSSENDSFAIKAKKQKSICCSDSAFIDLFGNNCRAQSVCEIGLLKLNGIHIANWWAVNTIIAAARGLESALYCNIYNTHTLKRGTMNATWSNGWLQKGTGFQAPLASWALFQMRNSLLGLAQQRNPLFWQLFIIGGA